MNLIQFNKNICVFENNWLNKIKLQSFELEFVDMHIIKFDIVQQYHHIRFNELIFDLMKWIKVFFSAFSFVEQKVKSLSNFRLVFEFVKHTLLKDSWWYELHLMKKCVMLKNSIQLTSKIQNHNWNKIKYDQCFVWSWFNWFIILSINFQFNSQFFHRSFWLMHQL